MLFVACLIDLQVWSRHAAVLFLMLFCALCALCDALLIPICLLFLWSVVHEDGCLYSVLYVCIRLPDHTW
jgi:hypothetical protein